MQLISQSTAETIEARNTGIAASWLAWLGTAGVLVIFDYLAFNDGGYFSRNFYTAAIGALMLLGLVILAQWDDFRLPATGGTPLLALALVTAWTGISAVWSIAPNLSMQEFGRVTIYLVCFAVILSGPLTRRSVKITTGLLVGIITGLAGFAMLARIFPSYSEEFVYAGGRLMGSIGYWNGLAALMAIGIVPALWLSSSTTMPRVLRVVSAGAMALIALTLFYTLSRGGIAVSLLAVSLYLLLAPERLASLLTLAAAAIPGSILVLYSSSALPSLQAAGDGVAIDAGEGKTFAFLLAAALLATVALKSLTLLLPARIPGGRNGRIFIVVFWGSVLLVLAGAAIVQWGSISGKIDQWRSSTEVQIWQYNQATVDEQGPERLTSTSDNRTEFWRIGLENFDEHPLVGTGAGTYRFANMRLQSGTGLARDPHSIWIRFLSDQGAIGFLLLLALVASLGVGVVNQLMRKPWLRKNGLYLALLIAALVWMADTSFEWNWALPAVAIPFFIIVALLFRLGAASEDEDTPEEESKRLRKPRPDSYQFPVWLRMAVLGVAMPITLMFLAFLTSVIYVGNARDSLAVGDIALADSEASRAHRLNPLAVEPYMVLAQARAQAGSLDDAEGFMLDALDRQPDSSSIYEELARLEFYDLKKTDQGLNDLTTAIDLDPQNDPLHILLHQMLYDAGVYESTGKMPPHPDILRQQ